MPRGLIQLKVKIGDIPAFSAIPHEPAGLGWGHRQQFRKADRCCRVGPDYAVEWTATGSCLSCGTGSIRLSQFMTAALSMQGLERVATAYSSKTTVLHHFRNLKHRRIPPPAWLACHNFQCYLYPISAFLLAAARSDAGTVLARRLISSTKSSTAAGEIW